MKRYRKYLLPLLALATACTESPSEEGPADGRSGYLRMEVSATRTEADSDAYDPLDHLVVRIYNDEGGLLRKYTSSEAMPERLALLAGRYRVAVEAGEAAAADFARRYYSGEEEFTVTAGATTPAEVVCHLRSTAVEARFDATVGKNFEPGYYARIVVGDSYDPEAEAGLRYTSDATGYFTLPEGATAMTWRFEGTHRDPERGTVAQEGHLDGLKAGGRYALTFRYSPDRPGQIEALLITVQDPDRGEDDTIIFAPDPTIEGVDFDMTALQRYTGGERRFIVKTVSQMQTLSLTIDGADHTLFNAAEGATLPEGIVVETADNKEFGIALSEAFIEGLGAGDHTFRFRIADQSDGRLEAVTEFRIQGLQSVTPADYDLWSNTVTLRAVSFEAAETLFTLTEEGGATQQAAGSPQGDDCYEATFTAAWGDASDNGKGHAVWSARTGMGGVWARHSYTYSVTLGGETLSGTFTTAAGDAIPDGDMENAELPCFTIKGSETTAFWGSGNNGNTKTLCTQGDMGGNRYANMQSTYYIVAPAAGNLFTGTFRMSGTTGTVSFGQPYAYTARPTGLRLRYHASVGTVDYNKGNGPLAVGEQDQAIVYVAIVDWDSRHQVASKLNLFGTSTCTGSWNPENGPEQADVPEGRIIGYAMMRIDRSTEGDELVPATLPFNWYDTAAPAPTGTYTLVISSSANAYGDFFNGCTTNHLWVDDFEWVY